MKKKRPPDPRKATHPRYQAGIKSKHLYRLISLDCTFSENGPNQCVRDVASAQNYQSSQLKHQPQLVWTPSRDTQNLRISGRKKY